MATQLALHVSQSDESRAKSLGVRAAVVTPEQAARNAAADIVRTARGTMSQTAFGDACGVPQQHVAVWEDADSPRAPSLIHLMRAAQLVPGAVRTLAERVGAACGGEHVARPVAERVLSVMSEIGDVCRELHAAMADGRIDSEERARLRREIAEARAALDALERDLEVSNG